MKNNFRYILRKKALFYTFANRTLNWLIRRQLNPYINFCIHMLQYVVLVEVYEENLASHSYVVGKGGPYKIPKLSWEPSGVLRLHFENHCPRLRNTLAGMLNNAPV